MFHSILGFCQTVAGSRLLNIIAATFIPPTEGQIMSPVPLCSAVRTSLVLILLVSCGCSSVKTTNTARSSVEQMLISNAVDQSLDKINFHPFAGHKVFLEEKYIDCVDKAYVIGSIRHRLLHVGCKLVDKVDDAEIVLEPRSGTVGTTNSDSYVGIPEITLPGMMTLPEVRVATKTKQVGVAKIGIAAYDAKSRTSLGEGGVTLAQSDDTNISVFGIGPYQKGTIRNEVIHSTSGKAGITRDRLPVEVAFSTPAPADVLEAPAAKEAKVQYTSVEEPAAEDAPEAAAELPDETPASPSDKPSWAE
ncbi:MAG: hypothetical protein DWH81_10005 [Planctomycetota bacterium]|nr:MAG: hypothetical protein DWH81_10005 [Planctomycetota bacterium]